MTIDTTQFNQIVQEVREALLAGSQGVGEVEVVSSLSNIMSLPALRLVGMTETVVEAPIELLAIPAVEAAADARKATDEAIVAAVNAAAAADLSEAERKDLDEIKLRTTLAGNVASTKGDKALLEAVNAEKATLHAMQIASDLQTKLEQAQVIILSGADTQEVIRLLNKQVQGEIVICAQTREEAREAILQLRELQTQVATAIRDAYLSLDEMQLSISDSKSATALAYNAIENIESLSGRAEKIILEVREVVESANRSASQVSDLVEEVLFSKTAADLAAAAAGENAGLAGASAEAAELVRQKAIRETNRASLAADEADKAAADAIFSAGGADSAAGHAIEQAEAARMAAERSNVLSDNPAKIIDNEWYKYDEETGEYIATGIQAKGDVGSSFRVVGNYKTYDLLLAAVPDGTGVDGVYGVGEAPPYTYYAWTLKGAVWGWHSQGMLQGQRGESAFEGAVRMQGYKGTEQEYAVSPILNAKLALDAAKKAGEDTADFLKASGKSVTDTIVRMTKLSDNPMKIIEGVWYKYDEEKEAYTNTGIRAIPIDWRVRDLDHEPTAADITYHDEGTGLDVAYPIGAEVRVLDGDEYTFYKLYDLVDGVASWDESGGGGALKQNVFLTGADHLAPNVIKQGILNQE